VPPPSVKGNPGIKNDV
jgi:hypothetical protein